MNLYLISGLALVVIASAAGAAPVAIFGWPRLVGRDVRRSFSWSFLCFAACIVIGFCGARLLILS